MNTEVTPGALGSNDRLGPTLELLNRVLPCNPPWGPGQYVNVECVWLLLAAERERCALAVRSVTEAYRGTRFGKAAESFGDRCDAAIRA